MTAAAQTDQMLLAKLTLAIPVYNEKDYIRETLESCIHQAGAVWIYDNASDDGTSEVCAEYAARFAHVKHIRHAENLNAFNNFRAPLFACNTEYFQWVGSHDILSKDFTLPLLRALEKDPNITLAFGKIVHIDESGKPTGKKRRSYYSKDLLSDNPLTRMRVILSNMRDCFIMHGVFRTKAVQAAWHDVSCIGFDDALLFRAASIGKFAFSAESTFHARNFPNTRKDVDNQKRREEVLSLEKDAPSKGLQTMTRIMMDTVTTCPQFEGNLTEGFQVLNQIYLRYFEPRAEKKNRRHKKILSYLAIGTIVVLSGLLLLR